MARKSTNRGVRGNWVFVPEDAEEAAERDREEVQTRLFGLHQMDFPARCKALDQYYDYFPEDGGMAAVPDGGAWVLVKNPPHTEYTVPPLSFWFAEPWPMLGGGPQPKRVKVVTQQGGLGLFPSEFVVVKDFERWFEFVGAGIEARFFGGPTAGVPEAQLHYLRSRGIAKRDAIVMLVGSIRAHGVLWLEVVDPQALAAFT